MIISFIASFHTLLGVYLLNHKNKWGWPIAAAGNFWWMWVALHPSPMPVWGLFANSLVMLAFNLRGFVLWNRTIPLDKPGFRTYIGISEYDTAATIIAESAGSSVSGCCGEVASCCQTSGAECPYCGDAQDSRAAGRSEGCGCELGQAE